MTYGIRRFLILLAVACASNAWAGESLVSLFDKVSNAYGAQPPQAIRETGSMISVRKGKGTLVRLYRAPDHFRSVINYVSGAEVRTMIGAATWQQDEPASGALQGAIALQKARVELPWNMLFAKVVNDLGSVTDGNGKTLRVLEVPIEKSMKLIVEVDPETGRILRSRGQLAIDAGKMLEFATVYSNFQKQQGRIHAMLEQHFVMGQAIGQSIIENIEYPQTLTDEVFAPVTAREEI